MSLFEVRGLTRAPWFRAFDLRLEAGEVAVLRGASGSGKTLFLRALADLDPADAGEVRLEGRSLEAQSAHAWRRHVRYVHQRPPRLAETVGASLARAGGVLGAAAEPWTREAPPGLSLEQRTADLSGGEAQRLALFVALQGEPRVLLLDEPTSALDDAAAAEAEASVRAFARAGGAVLWISHDATLAARLGAREVPFP